jgi:hypothetical protein
MFTDRWGGMRLYWGARRRAKAIQTILDLSDDQRKRLERDGISCDLIPKPRGYGIRRKNIALPSIPTTESEWAEIYGDLELSTQDKMAHIRIVSQQKEEVNNQNKQIERVNKEADKKDKDYDERQELAEKNAPEVIIELDRSAKEHVVRAKSDIDYQRHEASGGSATEIAKDFLQSKSHHLLAQDFETMFNLPGTEAREAGDSSFGDAIDKAMRAYYIIGLSERKSEMERLMGTDGFRKLIESMVDTKAVIEPEDMDNTHVFMHNEGGGYEQVETRVLTEGEIDSHDIQKGNDGKDWIVFRMSDGTVLVTEKSDKVKIDDTYEKVIKDWIGKPNEWAEEGKRDAEDVKAESDHRGELTKQGNLWTKREILDERLEVRQIVRNFVGGVDAEVAEEIAFRMFKTLGIAASFGTERYKDDDGKPDISQEGFPESDDLVKLMNTKEWQLKMDSTNSPCGAKALRGKLDRIAVDFISFQSSKIDLMDESGNVVKDDDGEAVQVARSFKEQWWGYNLNESRNLGQINWRELQPDVMRIWRLRTFIGAREGGFLDRWKTVAWGQDKLFSTEFFEGFNQMTAILFGNPVVFTNGFLGDKRKINGKVVDPDTEEGKDAIKEWVKSEIKNIKETWWDAIAREHENQWLQRSSGAIKGYGSHYDEEVIEREFMKKAGFFD